MAWYGDSWQQKAFDEATIIVGAFAEHDIEIGVMNNGEGWIEYMFAENQLLAREAYLEEIERALLENDAVIRTTERVIKDIVLLKLAARESAAEGDNAGAEGEQERSADSAPPEGDGEIAEGDGLDLLRILGELEERFGLGIVTLNHVVTAASGSPCGCPATEPQETYDKTPFPPKCTDKESGAGVRIYVADTGIVPRTPAMLQAAPWLNDVDLNSDTDPSVQGSTIMTYGGHGTFVTGVIRCMAPGAEILVKSVFDIAGSALESDFVPRLHEGFKFGADIFHVTVASPTRHAYQLIGFETWLQDLRQRKGVICIAPAGNSNSRDPFWPGAFSDVISVGALSNDWRRRAYFSDYGGWVDVYAPGENLVNAFPEGEFTCQITPYTNQVRTFYGSAQWSGTSFSTPIVTGLIAARMTRLGESAQEAADALLAEARSQAIPGVGPTLLPGCDGCPGGDRGGCSCDHDHGQGGGCGCGHGRGCGCGGHGSGGHGHGGHGHGGHGSGGHGRGATRGGCGCPGR
jgi:hypothetical protein